MGMSSLAGSAEGGSSSPGIRVVRRTPRVPFFLTRFGLRLNLVLGGATDVIGLRIRIGRRTVWVSRLGEGDEARFAAAIPTGAGWKSAVVEAVTAGRGVRLVRYLFFRFAGGRGAAEADYPSARERWGPEEEAVSRRLLDEVREPPSFSVLVPVFNPDPLHLREAIDSVRAQVHPGWELILADDASDRDGVGEALARAAAADPRIRVVRNSANRHISRTSNRAAAEARHPWLALLDHDDKLAPDALAQFALALDRSPSTDFLYADEDKWGADGRRRSPYFKPALNRVLLESQNYICHPAVFRADLFERTGGFREGVEGAQDWDLFLRMTAGLARDRVRRVPRVLYHWREHPGSTADSLDAKPYVLGAARRVVGEARARRGLTGGLRLVGGMYWDPEEPEEPVAALCFGREGKAAGPAEWVRIGGDDLPPGELSGLGRRLGRFAADPQIGVVGFRTDAPGGIVDCGIAAHPEGGLLRLFAGAERGEPGMGWRASLPQEIGAVAGRVVFFRRELREDLLRWREKLGAGDAALCGLCRAAWRKGYAVVLDAATVLPAEVSVRPPFLPAEVEALRAFDPDWFLDDPMFHPRLEPVSGPLKPIRF